MAAADNQRYGVCHTANLALCCHSGTECGCKSGEGFTNQITTYAAREDLPWKYVWLEFDGLRVAEYIEQSGLSLDQPIYRPLTPEQGQHLGRSEEHTSELQSP